MLHLCHTYVIVKNSVENYHRHMINKCMIYDQHMKDIVYKCIYIHLQSIYDPNILTPYVLQFTTEDLQIPQNLDKKVMTPVI